MSDWDPATTPNFSQAEMACKHCGDCQMRQDFMEKLQALRDAVGPLRVNSGYRCREHPNEVEKGSPGAHSQGRAVDLAWPTNKHKLISAVFEMGFQGIGIEGRFLHIDNGHDHAARPAFWTY